MTQVSHRFSKEGGKLGEKERKRSKWEVKREGELEMGGKEKR